MAKKKITMDLLAGMVQREFVNLDGRIGRVENEVRALREETKGGFEMLNKTLKDGFQLLAGEIMAMKEREKEQRHEDRIRHLELKVGIHR